MSNTVDEIIKAPARETWQYGVKTAWYTLDQINEALGSQARQIEALTQELTEARAEIVECDALRTDMASILRAVAIAVRGPEVDGISWGWADLPDRVTAAMNMMSGAVELAREHAATSEALTAERDEARAANAALHAQVADWHRKAVEMREERDELRKRLDDAKPATPAPGEWIEWRGGNMAPVADGVWHQVRLRSGGDLQPNDRASALAWDHQRSRRDIVAYRILP